MPRIVSDKAGGWWLGTVVFAFTLAFLLLGAKKMGTKGENGLKYTLVTTAVFCCWLMWGILYMAQMNPLINPILGE